MDLCSPKRRGALTGAVMLWVLTLTLTLVLALALPQNSHAQRKVNLDSVRVTARQPGLQTLPLYNNWEEEGEPRIGNFYALNVYRDGLGSEIWFTPSPCLRVTAAQSGDPRDGLRLDWDKLSEGCPSWMGMGIGWDDWSPKNMSEVLHRAALYLRVRALKGPGKGLPMAFALEDYAGAQCWLGYQPKYLKTSVGPGLDTSGWSELVLPLEDFEWERSNARPDNIKQLILQFEARGSLVVDEIRWIPYQGHPPIQWTGPWLDPSATIQAASDGFSVWRGKELRIAGSLLDWPPGQWTFGITPEPLVWKRSARLSDVTVHSSQFQRVEGQDYKRYLLNPDQHPGFRPNATYHVRYRPDDSGAGAPSAQAQAQTQAVSGTLQFLTPSEE